MSWISLRRTPETGATQPFQCPRCQGDQARRFKAPRRLFLFNVSVLPMGGAEPFTECARCGRTYSARSLADGGFSEDEKAVQALVATVIMADSRVRSQEMEIARRVLERHGGLPVKARDLPDRLHRIRRSVPEPIRLLKHVAPLLGERAKLRIVQAVYEVCAADDELHPAETRLIRTAGEALDLSPMRVREAMRRGRDR